MKCRIGEKNRFGYAVGFGFGVGVGGLDGSWVDAGKFGVCVVDKLGRKVSCRFGKWGIFGLGFAAGLRYGIGDAEVVGVRVNIG